MELQCRLHTGLRVALSGRRRGQVEMLALAVVPPRRPSTLVLHARSAPDELLAGYDVYSHPPGSKTTERLGRTDRRGRLPVPPAESPLRLLIVRHGEQPLARLPVVPGLEPELTAGIPNDDQRLRAEGVITGLQEDLVDLVIRREVLITRAKARLEAGRIDEAGEMIDQVLRLAKSKTDLAVLLAQQRGEIRAQDPTIQAKIEALFNDTAKLLQKHFDPEPVEALRDRIRQAQSAAGS
jgi:hypothetical protein